MLRDRRFTGMITAAPWKHSASRDRFARLVSLGQASLLSTHSPRPAWTTKSATRSQVHTCTGRSAGALSSPLGEWTAKIIRAYRSRRLLNCFTEPFSTFWVAAHFTCTKAISSAVRFSTSKSIPSSVPPKVEMRAHPVRARMRSISCSKSCGGSRLTIFSTACLYFPRATAAAAASGSFSSWIMRRISCQALGVQAVALKPATAVTVPGKSVLASSFPLSERLDHGQSQTSQKFPLLALSPSGLTVAPSRTVHHHI